MSLSPTLLTADKLVASQASYVTASVTLNANKPTYIKVSAEKNGAAEPTSITSAGVTWVRVNGTTFATWWSQSVWRAMASTAQTGAITINFAAAHDACAWSVIEWTGADTSGTNGSGSVVQSAINTGTGTSLSVTLAAFGDAVNNAAFGAFMQADSGDQNISAGAGFIELSDVYAATGGGFHGQTEWKLGQDTSVDASWGVAGAGSGGVAIEVKAAASAGVLYTQLERGIRGMNRGMNTGGYR